MSNIEEFRELREHPGYLVSSLGRIISLRTEKERKCSTDKDGYLYFGITLNKKKKNLKVHRVVAEAFIPNPLNLEQVNHIDGNVKNNCVDNLEWVTNKQNTTHYHRDTQKIVHTVALQRIEGILEDYAKGMSQVDIARKYKVSATYVHRIVVKGDISKLEG